jgi:hypothetical protein
MQPHGHLVFGFSSEKCSPHVRELSRPRCQLRAIGEFPLQSFEEKHDFTSRVYRLWNFLLAFFTPFIVKEIKFRYGFVFASCNLLGAAVAAFFLYESSHLTLESVDKV